MKTKTITGKFAHLQHGKEVPDKWNFVDPEVQREGKAIILPNDPGPMPISAAISVLNRKLEEENMVMDVIEIIDAYPLDAAVSLQLAMKELYGWASVRPKMSWFGPVEPDLVTVLTGPNPEDFLQVPFGCDFTIPGVENPIGVGQTNGDFGPVLYIRGRVRKAERYILVELAQLTREILKTHSIYKGKAVKLTSDDSGRVNYNAPPSFFNIPQNAVDDLILNPEELGQIQMALWAPIVNTEACVRAGIPLKRGVLLEGTYGTGKTMTARATAKVCVDNGWTFILLDDVRGLKDSLLFAKRYAPAVVFAEDIDRLISERDNAGNDLLNTIDGVLSKDAKVMTVLTTNHVERINKAMLRPGRLDAVISIRPPGPKSVEKLIRLYGREMVSLEPLDRIGAVLQGQIPSTIREVVERAKLGMIYRGDKFINQDDLIAIATGMQRHLELLADKKPEPSIEEALGAAVTTVVRTAVNGKSEDMKTLQRQVGDIYEHVIG